MILVLASVVDRAASAFAGELASVTPAAVLTCRDLAEEAIDIRHPAFSESSLTIDGRKTGIGEIGGAINLLPQVLPDEMFFYAREEREYQAAEFQALLTFFLSALTCTVVGRPTPRSLGGGCTSSIEWRIFAQAQGLAVSPMELDTDNVEGFFEDHRGETFEVRCLDGRLIEASGTAADEMTVELARRANAAFLRAVFENGRGSPRFVSASAVPDVKNPATRRALIEYFAGAGRHT